MENANLKRENFFFILALQLISGTESDSSIFLIFLVVLPEIFMILDTLLIITKLVAEKTGAKSECSQRLTFLDNQISIFEFL